MKESGGDFTYNGIPIFNVGFSDFYTFVEGLNDGKRILSKNISREDLREFYKKSRNHAFGVCYEGVMIDMRVAQKK